MKLYELSADVEAVLNGSMIVDPETGEIMFDQENLDELKMQFEDKLESCAVYVKNLDAEANAIKDEETRLAQRRKSLESRIDYMKKYMLDCMTMADVRKVDTPKALISLRESKSVNVIDPSLLPTKYLVTKHEVNPDKKALLADLKQGEEITGAELVIKDNLQVK